MIKYFNLILFTFLSSITLIKSLDDDTTKAFTCMTLTNMKLESTNKKMEEINADEFSSTVLKCFLTIKEEQIEQIMNNIQEVNNLKLLLGEDYDKLTDTSDLSSFSEKKIEDAYKKLMKAMKDFRNMQNGLKENADDDDYDDYDEDDDDYFGISNKKGDNFFGWIVRAVKYIFKAANSVGGILLIMIFIFLMVRFIKSIFSNEKHLKKEKNENKEEDNIEEENNNENEQKDKEEKNEGNKEKVN